MENEQLQSLANQIGWCRTTKDYLIGLNDEFYSVAKNYQDIVDELRSQGYMADLLPQIEEMNREFTESSSDLIGHIEREHLAYIENQSVGIHGALRKIMEN